MRLLSSETSRTVLDLFTGLPLAGWLLSPVPALKAEVSVPACSPSFQGPFCPIIRKQYLLLAVLPNGVLYSAYRQGLYLASRARALALPALSILDLYRGGSLHAYKSS